MSGEIVAGVSPPRGGRTIKQNLLNELTTEALANPGEWFSVSLNGMNRGNACTTAAGNIGKGLATITTRNGILYVKVDK